MVLWVLENKFEAISQMFKLSRVDLRYLRGAGKKNKTLATNIIWFLALRADHVRRNSSQGILALTYPLPICTLLEMDLGSSWELEIIFSQGTWCSV